MILMRCLGKHSKHLLIFPIQWLRCHIKTSLHRNENLLYSRSSLKSTLSFFWHTQIKTATNQAFTSWTNGDKTWGVMPSQEQMRNNWWMKNRRSHKWCLHQKLLYSGEIKELVCKYNLDKQPIYSLKWYKVSWISINYLQASTCNQPDGIWA